MNRYREPGWIQIGNSKDKSGRRQLWARISADKCTIELCSGREGDDAYFVYHRHRAADSCFAWADKNIVGMVNNQVYDNLLNVITSAMYADELE